MISRKKKDRNILIPVLIVICFMISLSVILISGFQRIDDKTSESTNLESIPVNPDRNYNVIIITIDALRADHTGCYGYKKNTTPFLDSFCNESIVYMNAIPPAPVTRTSTVSLFTSTYYNEHNVSNPFEDSFLADPFLSRYSRGLKDNSAFPESMTTLAEILSENGYFTYGMTENNISYITKGFDVFDKFPWDVKNSDTTIALAKRKIDENKGNKFFMYFHFMATHDPYDPPMGYAEMFRTAQYKGKINFSKTRYGWIEKLNDKDISELNARYDGEVRFADQEIEQIIDSVRRAGIENKTIILIISDHGEALGEKFKRVGHGMMMPTVSHIPLILHLPYGISGRTDALVETVDIAPTILTLVGIPVPDEFHGNTLFNLTSEYAYSSDQFGNIAIRTKDLFFKKNSDFFIKMVKDVDHITISRYELHNLTNDPYALTNIAQYNFEDLVKLGNAAENYSRQNYFR